MITGSSPHAFLNRYRVERAKELLKTEAISITRISEMCGFNSGSAFSKTFRRIAG